MPQVASTILVYTIYAADACIPAVHDVLNGRLVPEPEAPKRPSASTSEAAGSQERVAASGRDPERDAEAADHYEHWTRSAARRLQRQSSAVEGGLPTSGKVTDERADGGMADATRAPRRCKPSSTYRHYYVREAAIIGGAAGISGAFNTPLGGIIFAVEECAIYRDDIFCERRSPNPPVSRRRWGSASQRRSAR